MIIDELRTTSLLYELGKHAFSFTLIIDFHLRDKNLPRLSIDVPKANKTGCPVPHMAMWSKKIPQV